MIKEGWTSKLNLEIWNKLHLSCCLAFRRVKYRKDYIETTDGYCRQSNCRIKITSRLPHYTNKLTVTIENYKPNIFHDESLKRRVLPTDKKILLDKLKGRSAYAVRSELADDALTEESCIAAHIPSLNALRVLKCKDQCPGDEQNAVLSLYELRAKHLNCIQRIDLHPFATQFSTPAQQSWYKKEFAKRDRSIISIDATGVGLDPPLKLKKCIYLYIICAQGMKTFSF